MLDQYLLNDEIKNAIKMTESLVQKNQLAEVISYLKEIKVDNLIVFAEYSPAIADYCQHEDMDSYWLKLWQQMGRFPTPAESTPFKPYQALKPQPTLSNFNLVRGMYFYNAGSTLYKTSNQDSKTIAFFERAASYHNFAALNVLTKFTLQTSSKKKLFSWLEQLKKSAKYHGTPVFLLCVFVCLELAKLQEKASLGQAATLQNALGFLSAAEYSEANSLVTIHNAYYGQGLAFSNQWGLSQISELKQKLLDATDLGNDKELSVITANYGKQLANEFNDFIASIETDVEQVIIKFNK